MPTSISSPDLDLDALVNDDESFTCECRHSDGAVRCGARATVRVTVLCAEESCDCAAAVYLICRHCLAAWRDKAQRGGVRLRVTPL